MKLYEADESAVELMSQLNEALMSWEWGSDEPAAVKLRSRDVYTPLVVVLRCLYTSRCKSTHGELWTSRVERSHGELWGSGLEAYFRSVVIIMDCEVSWWASHLSIGHNDREWRFHGKPRVPKVGVTFRSAIMIANGGLMISQEYLKQESPFDRP